MAVELHVKDARASHYEKEKLANTSAPYFTCRFRCPANQSATVSGPSATSLAPATDELRGAAARTGAATVPVVVVHIEGGSEKQEQQVEPERHVARQAPTHTQGVTSI